MNMAFYVPSHVEILIRLLLSTAEVMVTVDLSLVVTQMLPGQGIPAPTIGTITVRQEKVFIVHVHMTMNANQTSAA